jgi:hypothetical protein
MKRRALVIGSELGAGAGESAHGPVQDFVDFCAGVSRNPGSHGLAGRSLVKKEMSFGLGPRGRRTVRLSGEE